MDKECIALCDAMNRFEGIRTYESCCGHNKSEFNIWFVAESLEVLPELLYWFAGCHCGFYGWSIKVKTDCGMSRPTFNVEGPAGAYEEADEIARLMTEYREVD